MASFIECLVSTVVATIGSNVPHTYGPVSLSHRDSIPRVIWTRAEKQPSRLDSSIATHGSKPVLCHESIPVDIHIIAQNVEQAEAITDDIVRALYQILGSHGSFLDTQILGLESNEGLKTSGVEHIIRVKVPRPIYRETSARAKVEAFSFAPGTKLEAGWITFDPTLGSVS